jgi:hypothetical protein
MLPFLSTPPLFCPRSKMCIIGILRFRLHIFVMVRHVTSAPNGLIVTCDDSVAFSYRGCIAKIWTLLF